MHKAYKKIHFGTKTKFWSKMSAMCGTLTGPESYTPDSSGLHVRALHYL